MSPTPMSCDTFVVLSPFVDKGCVIFGKNSDRPDKEVQEVVYHPSMNHSPNSSLQCTYISINQVEKTNAVILSKPNWMWGAEMGANEKGVCIGNEAVWTKLQSEKDSEKKLLGMDLVRLGLERGNTAKEALMLIIKLLEEYGQGGPCSNIMKDLVYHNSFIICDNKEAYVLETAGHLWAVEHITNGFRNISNCLSIGTKIDIMSDGLKEKAKELGLWNGNDEFHFANAFSVQPTEDCQRFVNGSTLLSTFTSSGTPFTAKNMFHILRDEDSGICMREGSFVSTSSQVSVLSPPGSKRPSVHWFTGTPDPKLSVFKPFVFTSNVSPANLLICSDNQNPHRLYSLRQAALKTKANAFQTLAQMECKCYEELNEFLDKVDKDEALISELDDLFRDCTETEAKFYK